MRGRSMAHVCCVGHDVSQVSCKRSSVIQLGVLLRSWTAREGWSPGPVHSAGPGAELREFLLVARDEMSQSPIEAEEQP